MGLRINQNIAAQNAYRNLSITDSQMSKSLEKLSSGFRINRAADDAAGLSISEGLRAQIGGLKVAVRNTQDGVSVAQTAEGSLNEVTSILQRMRDLSVQASNSGATDSDAAAAANKEMSQLNAELDRIGSTTAFGKQKLLDGTFGSTVQTGSTGTVAALTTGKIAGLGTNVTGASWTFDLEQVGGSTTAPDGTNIDTGSGGTGITVTVPKVATDATPQDLAKTVNTAISDALKQHGYQGNEITMSAKVDSQNVISYSMGGAGDFKITNDTVLSGAPDVSSDVTNEGGLGIDIATLNSTGGNTGAFQVGANANQKISIQIGSVDSQSLGTAALDLTSDPDTAITVLDKALQSVSDSRASLGAYQNRFDHTINNLNVAVENLSA